MGLLLVLIPTLLLFQGRIEEHLAKREPTMKSFAGMSVIGLVGGFLVGITSVGSGSIIMMLLLLFYSFAPKVMVGTDIAHAVILTGVTSLLHWRAGNVDPHLVVSLLIGSIPGGILGSHLSTRVPVLVAAPNPVHGFADDGSKNAVGLKEPVSGAYAVLGLRPSNRDLRTAEILITE